MKKSNLFSAVCALVILVSFDRSLYAEASEDISERASVSAFIPWPTDHPSDAVYAKVHEYSYVYDTYTWWENSRIWIQINPVTNGPFVCGPDAVIQGGIQYNSSLITSSERIMCGYLYVSQIFLLSERGIRFDSSLETTIVFNEKTSITLPAPIAPQDKLLIIDKSSTVGSITSNPPGIDCGTKCSSPFAFGQTVELTAHPDQGYELLGWYGDCNGDGTCTLVMNEEKHVNYVYKKQQSTFGVGVSHDGNGTIKSVPTGIDCGTSCNAAFQKNTSVTLQASPNPTFRFKNWSGDCSGSKTSICDLDLTKDMQVSAYFESAVPQKALTVTTKGSGTVYDSFGLIDCGDQCTASYNRGTKVQLTVTPDEGWKFKKWTGACTGKRACTVNLKANRKVTAVFVPQ